VENVVATIETPSSHQGILRPDRKNSEELLPAFLEAMTPTTSETAKKANAKKLFLTHFAANKYTTKEKRLKSQIIATEIFRETRAAFDDLLYQC